MIKHHWVEVTGRRNSEVIIYKCSVCDEILKVRLSLQPFINQVEQGNRDENCDLAVVKQVTEL